MTQAQQPTTLTYEAWRITYQSSDQAARAAYESALTLGAELAAGNWYAADDVNRLVRELDVALNGKDFAAPQAMLCDVVGIVKSIERELGKPVIEALRATPPAPTAVTVPDAVIAGALFDFAGYLTTLPVASAITASEAHEASPMVDALKAWAANRSLQLDDADVFGWRALAATQETSDKPAAAPAIPNGWVPCVVTYEGQHPEEVAYGPQIMMDRLKKWLERYFELKAAAPVVLPEFDLRTSYGSRCAVAWYFANVLQRHDFTKYINNTLAADFACALAPSLLATGGQAQAVEKPEGVHADPHPTKCPITGRPYFMHLQHPEHGLIPTFGGPYDSYSMPYAEGEPTSPRHERELSVHRYDHDRGHWVEDESIPLRIIFDEALLELQEAAEAAPQVQDVQRDRWLEIGKAIERACVDLPVGAEIIVALEKDAGTVTLTDAEGDEQENFPTDGGLAGVVNAAIDAAIAASAAKGGEA